MTAPPQSFAPLSQLLSLLDGIDVRLGGGWGIDVLARSPTRAHHDADLFIAEIDVPAALARLAAAGFTPVLDARPCRMVLEAPADAGAALHRVDLNGLRYLPDGHAVQQDAGGDTEVFGAWAWTWRSVEGRAVLCLSAEAQRLKHRGYPARAVDEADLAAVAHLSEPSRFDPSVRPLEPGDRELLAGIEITADARYEDAGLWPLPPPATGPAAPGAATEASVIGIWVAGRPPVGFCRLERLGGHAHLAQVSVLPEAGRLGIGTSLVTAACRAAAEAGHDRVTLTTFAEPAFNGPWYRRMGFDDVAPPYGPELARLVESERPLAALGPRVVLWRPLP